jgi:rod shape determining protein RodA
VKIAIGSAGWWGKGYHQGSQTQLGFLSEPENGFILSAFIEEWGVLLGFMVLAAFVWLIWSVLKVGILADHNFEKFICLGTAIVLGVHVVLNAGSAVGLVPVVGVPFPFLSYGGSNLLMSFFLVGIVAAIRRSI